MKRILMAALTIVGTAMATFASGKLNVVATYDVYGQVAKAVGGDHVQVTALAKGNLDPHFVDPKPSYLVALHKADALLINGLELEVGFLPPLLQQAGNGKIQQGADGYVDLSRFVTPIEVPKGGADRSMGDVHPFGNPHYHLDPRNMALVARGVAAAFAKLDPPNAADYARNGDAAARAYLDLDAELAASLVPMKGEPVVTYHSSMDYFFQRYGIDIVGFVEPKPGIKPSPTSLLELERRMKEKSVRCVVTEPYQDLKIARKVASDTGAELVVVPDYTGGNPGADTYADLMRTIAKALLEVPRG
jgi:zinc/manganese transport system substrate-binding protein